MVRGHTGVLLVIWVDWCSTGGQGFNMSVGDRTGEWFTQVCWWFHKWLRVTGVLCYHR